MQAQSMQIIVDPSGHKVEVVCPGCGQKVVFSLTQAGNSVFCRNCGIQIEIVSEELEALKKQYASGEEGARRSEGGEAGDRPGGGKESERPA